MPGYFRLTEHASIPLWASAPFGGEPTGDELHELITKAMIASGEFPDEPPAANSWKYSDVAWNIRWWIKDDYLAASRRLGAGVTPSPEGSTNMPPDPLSRPIPPSHFAVSAQASVEIGVAQTRTEFFDLIDEAMVASGKFDHRLSDTVPEDEAEKDRHFERCGLIWDRVALLWPDYVKAGLNPLKGPAELPNEPAPLANLPWSKRPTYASVVRIVGYPKPKFVPPSAQIIQMRPRCNAACKREKNDTLRDPNDDD